MVCDYTARIDFAVCVEPVSPGGTCGARLNGSNTIGKTPDCTTFMNLCQGFEVIT